jgi:hypothetical protein
VRISDLERRAALMDIQAVPISAAFQALLVQELTHFHEPEMDALMAKLGPPFSLNEEEAGRLDDLLVKREQELLPIPEVSQRERDAALMLRLLMRRIAADVNKTGVNADPLIRVLITTREIEVRGELC